MIRTAPWNQGAGSVTSQGGVRTPLSGSGIAQAVTGSRARGNLERGPATGSCEGHPDDGRHPGSQRAAGVHARACPGDLRQLLSREPSHREVRREPRAKATGRSRGEEKRQGCQRLGLRRRPGSNRPMLVATKTRRSGGGCREASTPPVVSHGSQSPRVLPSARAHERTGNARGTGTRHFVRVADVGRMHLAPSGPGSRKAPGPPRALAGRKRTAPLTRGVRGEKAKRCTCLGASSRTS